MIIPEDWEQKEEVGGYQNLTAQRRSPAQFSEEYNEAVSDSGLRAGNWHPLWLLSPALQSSCNVWYWQTLNRKLAG